MTTRHERGRSGLVLVLVLVLVVGPMWLCLEAVTR